MITLNEGKIIDQWATLLEQCQGKVVALIPQHYEQFDSRYKGLLPLKRVYVPEVL